ncbi:MAG: molybdopterin-dependent oxidoreductase [Pseudomonadota bacterium]
MEEIQSLQTKATVCPLDCPDTCSLSVITNGLEILKVRGSKANPYTAGVICKKVATYYPDFVHGPRRLTQPLMRTGPRGSGSYQEISWDRALDIIYDRTTEVIDRFGPQAVLPFNYAGPHGKLAGGSMDMRFFHKLGASLLDRGPLCGAVRGAAYASLFGPAPGMPPDQAVDADLIVVVSNNVTVSNLHLARVIKTARRTKGAKLVVIDPKRTKIAEQADLFIQIKPGTDVVLFLALAAELERKGGLDHDFIARWVEGFEPYMAAARQYALEDAASICGVPQEDLSQLVDLYLTCKNGALSVGNGAERGHSGGSSIRAAMALQALTGNMGRRGAGVIAKPGSAFPATPDRLERPDLIPEGTRTLNIVDISKHLLDPELDPPLKALFIYNHNPLCTHPDQNRMRQALSQEELFIMGCDVVMTDSMAYADVILPAASHFEFADVYAAYGQTYLQRAEPVIPTVGEALPNTEIFRRLAARFSFDDSIFRESDHMLMDAALDGQDPRLQGLRPSELPLDRALPMRSTDGKDLIMCNTVVPRTPSGKVELFCDELERDFGYGLPRYEAVSQDLPLTIISPSSDKRTNATFGGHPESSGPEIVEIHPKDAAARSISTGDRVKVWNKQGHVILIAQISQAMRPGVVYSPKGTWLETSSSGQTANALIPADLRTDIMDGACYNETFVELKRV